MGDMFSWCFSLEELNISNFNTNNITNMSYMFGQCPDELHLKIQSQYKNFQEIAFDDYYSDDDYSDNSDDFDDDYQDIFDRSD